jgi:hypothetical protein
MNKLDYFADFSLQTYQEIAPFEVPIRHKSFLYRDYKVTENPLLLCHLNLNFPRCEK